MARTGDYVEYHTKKGELKVGKITVVEKEKLTVEKGKMIVGSVRSYLEDLGPAYRDHSYEPARYTEWVEENNYIQESYKKTGGIERIVRGSIKRFLGNEEHIKPYDKEEMEFKWGMYGK